MIIWTVTSLSRRAILLTGLAGMLLLCCHPAPGAHPQRERGVSPQREREASQHREREARRQSGALFKALYAGDLHAVRSALADGASANARLEVGGDTPLLIATSRGQAAIAQALLAAGASVNVPDQYEQSPLAFAAQQGHLPLVRILLARGADVNQGRAGGRSPLEMAVEGGSLPIVQLLLAHGADAHARDSQGNTALMSAASPAVARLLLARGAPVNAQNRDGDTALNQTLMSYHPALVAELLAAGADPNATDKEGTTPLSWAIGAALRGDVSGVLALLAHGADVNHADRFGQTALEEAAQYGEAEVVRLLLERGADPLRRDRMGGTALTRVAGEGGHGAGIIASHPHDDPPPAPKQVADLMENAALSDTAIVRSLLAKGSDAHGPEGRTALLLAAASGNVAVVRSLLAAGTAPDAVSTGPLTPLVTFYLFSEPGLDPASLDRALAVPGPITPLMYAAAVPLRMTPLMYAAYNGHPDVMQALLAGKADTNLQDASGATALMYAAERGQEDVVSLLLGQGADVNRRDKAGKTALMRLAARGAAADLVPPGRADLEPERRITPGMSREMRAALALVNADIRARNAAAAERAEAEQADLAIARALLSRGADAAALDAKGETALMLAEKAHNAALISVLHPQATP